MAGFNLPIQEAQTNGGGMAISSPDASGHILTAIYVNGSSTLDMGSYSYTLPAGDTKGVVLTKIAPDGTPVWSAFISTVGETSQPWFPWSTIEPDASGGFTIGINGHGATSLVVYNSSGTLTQTLSGPYGLIHVSSSGSTDWALSLSNPISYMQARGSSVAITSQIETITWTIGGTTYSSTYNPLLGVNSVTGYAILNTSDGSMAHQFFAEYAASGDTGPVGVGLDSSGNLYTLLYRSGAAPVLIAGHVITPASSGATYWWVKYEPSSGAVTVVDKHSFPESVLNYHVNADGSSDFFFSYFSGTIAIWDSIDLVMSGQNLGHWHLDASGTATSESAALPNVGNWTYGSGDPFSGDPSFHRAFRIAGGDVVGVFAISSPEGYGGHSFDKVGSEITDIWVFRWNPTAGFIWTARAAGTDSGIHNFPVDASVDATGNVFLAWTSGSSSLGTSPTFTPLLDSPPDPAAGYISTLASDGSAWGGIGGLPDAPTLSGSPGSGSASLSWTTISDAISYDVYQDGSSILTGITGTSTTVTGLTNGTSYVFTVRAVNGVGEGSDSNPVTVTPSPAPTAPTSVTCTPGDGLNSLSWSDATGDPATVDHWLIQRSYSGSGPFSTIATVTPASTTTYTDSGLVNGTTYYYRVIAVSDAESPPSSVVSGRPIPGALSTPSAAPSLTVENGALGVSWPAQSGAASYDVFIGTTLTISGVVGTTTTLTSLTNGTEYHVSYRAVDGFGTASGRSPEAIAKPEPSATHFSGELAATAYAQVINPSSSGPGEGDFTGTDIPAPPIYRFLVGRLAGEDGAAGPIITQLTGLTNVIYSEILNKPGNFSADISLSDPQATEENLLAGQRYILIERTPGPGEAPTIVWSGVLWGVECDYDTDKAHLTGSGLGSYFIKRFIEQAFTFDGGEDLISCARTLLTWAQGQPHGYIGLQLGLEVGGTLPDSGINIDAHQHTPVLDAITNTLAGSSDGFDFDFYSVWVEGNLEHHFTGYYPNRGAHTSIVWELGVNIMGGSVGVDASRSASKLFAVGGGTAADGIVASASTTIPDGEVVLEDTRSYTDVTSQELLQSLANRDNTALKKPVANHTIRLNPQYPFSGVGTFRAGDWVRVRANRGPIAVDDQFRVVQWQCSIKDDAEELTAEVAPAYTF